MTNDFYYKKLLSLSEADRLSIHLIVAPPRTNSSLVEHVIGNSSDIDSECHEPFLKSKNDSFDPESAYLQIYRLIGGEDFEKSDKKASVVVKEMSHSIGKDEEYKRLFELTKSPVLFLIRNPLLSVESRIRRVLTTMDMRSNINLQRYLLDDIAAKEGFKDWAELADAMIKGDYSKQFSFIQNEGNVGHLYDVPTLTLQNELLDLKANENGYVNWKDLLKKKLYEERDYAFFTDILKTKVRRFKHEKEEYTKLQEMVKFVESQQKKVLYLTQQI